MAKRGENIHKRKDGRWEGRVISKDALPMENRSGVTQNGYAYGKVTRRTDEAKSPVRILSAFRKINALFSTCRIVALVPRTKHQRVHLCTFISIRRCTNIFSVLAVCRVVEYDRFFAERLFLQISYRPQTGVTSHLAHPRHRNVPWDAMNLQIRCTSTPHAAHRESKASNCHTHRNQNYNLDPTEQDSLREFLYQNQPPVKSGCFCKWNLDRLEVYGLQWGF